MTTELHRLHREREELVHSMTPDLAAETQAFQTLEGHRAHPDDDAVANAIRTTRVIPPQCRREALTYSHHPIVPALPIRAEAGE